MSFVKQILLSRGMGGEGSEFEGVFFRADSGRAGFLPHFRFGLCGSERVKIIITIFILPVQKHIFLSGRISRETQMFPSSEIGWR